MARTNKYTSLNFNDIYEKKTTSAHRPNSASSSSPTSNKTAISNSRIHGHMLVLSRPTPKPISIPQPQTNPIKFQGPDTSFSSPPPEKARSVPDSDSISLRPQGRTGSGPNISSPPVTSTSPLQSPLPKSDRFVPPHLRPGFVGREEKPVTGGRGSGGPHRPGNIGSSPNAYGENGRPKSGGGYERTMVGGEAESAIFMNRPRSGGARPRSSG
ncbi:PREDICTED: uncharacterized protein LOC109167887 [Ipomoea nil]|uniref:uncharacterized protein LOC109167887 n=1 Tax=Ipomoea nil TaxID=35883 RepID=UPI000901160E|nr:PREDICTED: uncharacterized protein LOC109167887 [Ipomoea nil]